ncbi:MAG: hypothetical protein WA140_00585 [Geobacteraceae bacterium]
MIIRSSLGHKIALLLFIVAMPFALFLYAGPVNAAGPEADEASQAASIEGADVAKDEGDTGENGQTPVETHTVMGGFSGYRFLSVRSFGGRASEYDYLHSGVTAGAHLNSLGPKLKYGVEGSYLNNEDYHGDLLFDYKGYYRLHLRAESLFHNLDHERLFAPDFNSPDALGQTANYEAKLLDMAPSLSYGVRVKRELADLRLKPGDYPLHLNLGYWRLVREGSSQLRFSDHAFEGPPLTAPPTIYSNTIYSRTREIDRMTQEGNVGLDTHIGPVDLIYTFQLRQLEELKDIPRDNYIDRVDVANTLVRLAGLQQHNENPDSRFIAHTVKLHTSLSGGITGAVSYSYGKRDNRSNLTDIKGADQVVATLQNIVGDFTYTPCRQFSAAIKYRLQEVDTDSPIFLVSAFAAPSAIVPVRTAIDTRKETITVSLSFRPLPLLNIKGEYAGEFLHRDNINNGPSEMSWKLPEDSATHRGSLTLLSHPIRGVRLKALYSYAATDYPSYGASPAEKHEGQLLATYTGGALWGATANYRAFRETNDEIMKETINFPLSPLTFTPFPTPLSRDREGNNATLTLWVTPMERLTLTGSYGLLRTNTDQQVLLSSITPGVLNRVDFTSQAQIYGLNAAYTVNERLDVSLALQQIRSFAEFAPTPDVIPAVGDTSGLTDISRLRTVESTLSARAEYHMVRNVRCLLDYTYRDYDEKTSSLFDGTVQTVMAYISAKW